MTKKEIKLIMFDVDGTLVNDHQVLGDKTVAVIKKLKDKGLLVSLATGKIFPSIQKVIHALDLKDPLVLSNGALIQNPDGAILFEKYMSPELLELILEIVSKHQADLALFTPAHIFVLRENFNTDHIKCIFREKITVVGDWCNISDYYPWICKAIFINRTSQTCIDEITGFFSNITELECTISTGASNAVEILPPNVSKKNGMIQLCRNLGVNIDQVMAFGDHINDLGMIKSAGMGVSVGNAIEEIKNAADYVIGTNNDQGPADFLADYFSDLLIKH